MAEQLKNQWLVQNNRPFQALKRQLMEYQYKGLDDLPSRTIQGMMESAVIEIARLQRELDSANEEIKQLKSTDTVTKKDGE
jgi:hypothetical protein